MAGSPRFVQTTSTGDVVDVTLRLSATRETYGNKVIGESNPIKRCAVLAAVNIASRRLRRWPMADVDRRSARLTLWM
jgi:hypothetical protein